MPEPRYIDELPDRSVALPREPYYIAMKKLADAAPGTWVRSGKLFSVESKRPARAFLGDDYEVAYRRIQKEPPRGIIYIKRKVKDETRR